MINKDKESIGMKAYMAPTEKSVASAYNEARERYAALEVDTDDAIARVAAVPISLHCWQADDVAGFEALDEDVAGGGIMAIGNYPGRARNGDELRQDFDQVMSLLPGVQRANLHAFYAEADGARVLRDEVAPEHFAHWIDWAKDREVGLDFNPTYFAHPKADDGFTLSHKDQDIRAFWIRHGIASRRIAEHMGRELSNPCVNNHWIPDGSKDSPADRWSPRKRLVEAFDQVLSDAHGFDGALCVDAVESKLFGLGSEDYVVGSMEFYTAYALTRKVVQCLDMGHFHPTETIHDKISALMQFQERMLIHTSRPIRWDSDHVVLFNDDVRNVFFEIMRGDALDRVYVALDFFDASINRIAAYVIGTRATRKAILAALLDPSACLRELEDSGKLGQKLGLMEEQRTMPFGAVWDMLCQREEVPVGAAWISEVETYEAKVLSKRG
jgi:L-rhamnose isomerase